MVLGAIVDSEKTADAILADLQAIFGARVFDALAATIVKDHLGGEMDVRTAIMQRPDLFERAFIAILGEIGERVLAFVCNKLQAGLPPDENSSSSIVYSKA
ncbi:hypothetical protein [Nitrososphaera viennensis]|uniref:Nitrososphaera output domain-containing protein n=2 Tax=Nitrososphaera viennensis TaxID=1034015 RepID=A0A060HP42_9ARCH|nr:hypothetical protein [Nitrososphaera viennensis]AIC16890.1 hypothetical protein NVIE_026210 [Nitrososphaera viennensis EN76]UVS68795.1 hypothetical protein NWT39_12920 [Nitrososphaera viennensis]